MLFRKTMLELLRKGIVFQSNVGKADLSSVGELWYLGSSDYVLIFEK